MLWRKVAAVPVAAIEHDTPVARRAKELLGDMLAVSVANVRPGVWRSAQSEFDPQTRQDPLALQLLWNAGLAQRAGFEYGCYDSRITSQGALAFGMLRV